MNKPRHSNIHKAERNDSKAASLFEDFDFGPPSIDQPSPQQGYQPSEKAQDVFADLFGDFSSNSPKNVNDISIGDIGGLSNEKQSVQEVMKGAYNNKSYNKTTATVQPRNKNLFDDLFD